MSLELARQFLARARSQLERVRLAAEGYAPDPESAVMWAFYAYENSVVTLAELHGRAWAQNHYAKARLARELYAEQLVSRDIGDELEELNRLRKDVAYGEPGAELEERDLGRLAFELEGFIDEIESRMEALT